MNMNERTTIAAISTAMSNSGIGIVRMEHALLGVVTITFVLHPMF